MERIGSAILRVPIEKSVINKKGATIIVAPADIPVKSSFRNLLVDECYIPEVTGESLKPRTTRYIPSENSNTATIIAESIE